MSPKTTEQFAAMRQQRQQKIEAVALRLFAKKGFHNTSISSIAKEAGISKGLLYNYYAGKEKLLISLLEHHSKDFSGEINTILHSKSSPQDKLLAFTESMIQIVRKNSAFWKLLTSLTLQKDLIENLKGQLEQRKQEIIRLAATFFEQMGYNDPFKEAMIYGATLDGMMLRFLSLEEDYPMEEMKNYLIQKYQL